MKMRYKVALPTVSIRVKKPIYDEVVQIASTRHITLTDALSIMIEEKDQEIEQLEEDKRELERKLREYDGISIMKARAIKYGELKIVPNHEN